MRIAVIADVHGNAAAVDAVLEVIDALKPTHIFALGNLVGRGPQPGLVMQRLRDRNIPSLRGHWDDQVADESFEHPRPRRSSWLYANRQQLDADQKSRLSAGPRLRRIEVGGISLLLSHGNPQQPDKRLTRETADEDLREALTEIDCDVVAIGRGHHGFVRHLDGALIINCGSVGFPVAGDPRACFGLIHLDSPPRAELVRVPYRIGATVKAAERRLADGFTDQTSTSRYLRALLGKGPEPYAPLHADDLGSTALVKLLGRRTRAVYRRATSPRAADSVHVVHKVRVGTRRLRAAIRIARPLMPAKATARALRQLRDLGRALGARRDTDVMLDHLREVHTEGEAEAAVIARAMRLVQVRQRRMTRRLHEQMPKETLLSHGLRLIGLSMRPRASAPSLLDAISAEVVERIAMVRARAPQIDVPDDHEGHHDLRTAIKQLRYALEVAAEPAPVLADARVVVSLRAMQKSLGALHDIRETIVFVGSRRIARRADRWALSRICGRLASLETTRYREAHASVSEHLLSSLAIVESALKS